MGAHWSAAVGREHGARASDHHGQKGAGGVSAAELERWLYAPRSAPPSLDDVATAFGLSLDALAERPPSRLADAAPRALTERLRLTLAVLRDVFPTDGAVRRWMRAPIGALDGDRPLDLLLRDRVEELERIAVAAWNAHSCR